MVVPMRLGSKVIDDPLELRPDKFRCLAKALLAPLILSANKRSIRITRSPGAHCEATTFKDSYIN